MSLEPVTCDPINYHFCGDTTNLTTRTLDSGSIAQTLSVVQSVTIGGTEIFVRKRTRNFSLTYEKDRQFDLSTFAIFGGGEWQTCGQPGRVITGNVSESYTYISTVIYFLDSRYGNAFYKTTTETVTFSAPADEARFIGIAGAEYYGKYVVKNHVTTTQIDYCLMIDGVVTVAKSSTNAVSIHGADNPLILVFPQPPSTGYFQDDDISQFGFYDYQDNGQIEKDGGDDFYFTDWMRGVGLVYRDTDQDAAWNRYFSFYLNDGEPSKSFTNVAVPKLLIDYTPIGSIAVSRDEDVFYSAKFPDGPSASGFIINDVAVDIPKDSECDIWHPIRPL